MVAVVMAAEHGAMHMARAPRPKNAVTMWDVRAQMRSVNMGVATGNRNQRQRDDTENEDRPNEAIHGVSLLSRFSPLWDTSARQWLTSKRK